MRSKRLAAAALAAATLAVVPAAAAGTMHPEFGAHLSGMGETGVVNLTAHSKTHRLCWNFQLHVAFWVGMALCDNQSAPEYTHAPCKPDSDENIFDGRFMFIHELARLGADIRTDGHHAVVRGKEQLSGAPVRATIRPTPG